jgi:hypothetical protein
MSERRQVCTNTEASENTHKRANARAASRTHGTTMEEPATKRAFNFVRPVRPDRRFRSLPCFAIDEDCSQYLDESIDRADCDETYQRRGIGWSGHDTTQFRLASGSQNHVVIGSRKQQTGIRTRLITG